MRRLGFVLILFATAMPTGCITYEFGDKGYKTDPAILARKSWVPDGPEAKRFEREMNGPSFRETKPGWNVSLEPLTCQDIWNCLVDDKENLADVRRRYPELSESAPVNSHLVAPRSEWDRTSSIRLDNEEATQNSTEIFPLPAPE